MNIDPDVLFYISTYGYLAIFFGAFFFGETVLLTAAFLAGQGFFSLSWVLVLAWTGTVLADSMWFFIGQKFSHWLWSNDWRKKKYEQAARLARALTSHSPFWSLLYIKFLYGTRLFIILYLASVKMPFPKFFLLNGLGALLWLLVMMPLAFLAGKGIDIFFSEVAHLEIALAALLFLILGVKFLHKWTSKKITNQ